MSLSRVYYMSFLTIKKHKERVVLSYDEMFEELVQQGIIGENITNIREDRERLICFFEDNGKKYVLKMGNHEKRHDNDDFTKYELLKKEDAIYNKLGALAISDRARFPQVYDGGDIYENFYFLLMEQVEGVTLYDYLQAPPSKKSKTEVLTILINLTLAIQALYSLNFVHGDLSIENVMVGLDGGVKLIDFEKTYTIKTGTNIESNIRGKPSGWRGDYRKPGGIGYFYLIVITLHSSGNYDEDLIITLKNAIDTCIYPLCHDVYKICGGILMEALGRGSRTGSSRGRGRATSRRASSRGRGSRGSRSSRSSRRSTKT